MVIFLSFLHIVYILSLFLLLCVLIVYLQSLLLTRVPFLWLSQKKLPEILDALKLTSSAVLYDLGCGDARVLFAATRRVPNARCVGVDVALAAYLLARLRRWYVGNPKNVTLIKANFFNLDLSNATHIYCYLYPNVMDELHQKFLKQLKPGTRVISCDFEIAHKTAIEVIQFKKNSRLGKSLYVYEY